MINSISRKICQDTRGENFLENLRNSWVEFLSRFEWHWFCTLTFRDAIHPEAAAKLFSVFISKVNRRLFGCHWYEHSQGVRWVLATEKQKRGVIHYHLLIGSEKLPTLRRLDFMDKWNKIAGYARIQPLNRSQAVMRYVSKYATKAGEIELGGYFSDKNSKDYNEKSPERLPTPDRGGIYRADINQGGALRRSQRVVPNPPREKLSLPQNVFLVPSFSVSCLRCALKCSALVSPFKSRS